MSSYVNELPSYWSSKLKCVKICFHNPYEGGFLYRSGFYIPSGWTLRACSFAAHWLEWMYSRVIQYVKDLGGVYLI